MSTVEASTVPTARTARRPPGNFRVRVVGLTFAPDYPGCVQRLDPALWGHRPVPERARLVLRRQPDNPADPNAVAVVNAETGEHLGHLPAHLAARLAPDLDAGATWEVASWEVVVSPRAGDQPGLEVEVRRG